MLYYGRIDLSEEIDPTISNKSKDPLFVTLGFLIIISRLYL